MDLSSANRGATAAPGYRQTDGPSVEDLTRCVQCGLCLTSCPTFVETRSELESPRGRLYLMRAMGEGRMVAAHLSESPWYELSTLDRYLAISLEFLQREGRQLILDQGCRIEEGALVERSVLWKGVRVERGAKLFECIVGDNVVIPAGADFKRAAIVRADAAGASEKPGKALPAELIGENLVVHFG